MHGDFLDQRLEVVGPGHEIRLAVDLDQDPHLATRMDVVARPNPGPWYVRRVWRLWPDRGCEGSVTALSRSPSASVRAALHSIKPAAVMSRSSLTCVALIAIVSRIL